MATKPDYIVPIITLLNRQLSDWKQHFDQLQTQDAPITALAYCQAQIDRIQGEIDALSQ